MFSHLYYADSDYQGRGPMPIQSGTHLGPYEILSAIGAGGMGEVYRARDPKLGRDSYQGPARGLRSRC